MSTNIELQELHKLGNAPDVNVDQFIRNTAGAPDLSVSRERCKTYADTNQLKYGGRWKNDTESPEGCFVNSANKVMYNEKTLKKLWSRFPACDTTNQCVQAAPNYYEKLTKKIYTNPGGHTFVIIQNMILFAILHVCLIAAIEIGFYFFIIKKKERDETQGMINGVGTSSAESILSQGAYYVPSKDNKWTPSAPSTSIPTSWTPGASTPVGNKFQVYEGKIQFYNSIDGRWQPFSTQPSCTITAISVDKMKIYAKCENGDVVEQAEGINVWKVPRIRDYVQNKVSADAKTAKSNLNSALEYLKQKNSGPKNYALGMSKNIKKWSISKVLVVVLGVTLVLICFLFPPASILGPISTLINHCFGTNLPNINYRNQDCGSRYATCTPFKTLQKLFLKWIPSISNIFFKNKIDWEAFYRRMRLTWNCGNAHLKWSMFEHGFYELLLTLALICAFEWVFFFHVAVRIVPITGAVAKDQLIEKINTLFHSKLSNVPVLSAAEQASALRTVTQREMQAQAASYIQNRMAAGTGNFAELVGNKLGVPVKLSPVLTSSALAHSDSTEINTN